MTDRVLHFTLGPVQGFVAQARRTSDLWAGSFLLSWLAGRAMLAVSERGGEILVPAVKGDPLFEGLARGGGLGPAIGSLPNRFKAKVPEGFDASVCRAAIAEAWRGLADAVWTTFVEPVTGLGAGTEAIWQRQVESFWDTAWVIGPDTGDDDAWLDRRKNWRTHRPPVEGGDHCMLMGDWQELSGYVRAREREKQDAFWAALRQRAEAAADNPLTLDDRERLCAMALIKRVFPVVAPDALGWTPSWDGQTPVRWPSTPRLAAAGWLRHASSAAPREAQAFIDVAKEIGRHRMEPALSMDNELSRVAGALLHRSGIENARADDLGGPAAEGARAKLLEAFDALIGVADGPSAYYALLLMDGDSIGALLHDQEKEVAAGLARFSQRVDGIVRQHGGNTVYAGGDDALALLPLEAALAAAVDLREAYIAAMSAVRGATISAAIVFAHFHAPLRHVLEEAHRQLDEVAKDGNGRDSLALCVLSQSGVLREWVATWEAHGDRPPALLRSAGEIIEEDFASGFFYALAERYAEVLADPTLAEEDFLAVLKAEHRRRRDGAESGDDKLLDQLLRLSRRYPRESGERAADAPAFSLDGPMMARFLAGETRP